jgi:hypothetical protein
MGVDNISLLPILIVHQGDPGVTVRVVFNRHHFGGDVVLVALKVDDPVKTLVTSTSATAGNYTAIVPTFRAMN